jgi:hypothetical protein
MAQAMTVSHPPITAEAWVGQQASSCAFHCLRNGTGIDFSPSSLILFISIIPTIFNVHIFIADAMEP